MKEYSLFKKKPQNGENSPTENISLGYRYTDIRQCFFFLAKFRHFSTKKLGKINFAKILIF
jgi:hypothetical protein